jgi:hypothetical protein
MHDVFGWAATAVFTCSYLFRSAVALRWVQAAAAVLWIAYGVIQHAPPVIAANVIVAAAATASVLRERRI